MCEYKNTENDKSALKIGKNHVEIRKFVKKTFLIGSLNGKKAGEIGPDFSFCERKLRVLQRNLHGKYKKRN